MYGGPNPQTPPVVTLSFRKGSAFKRKRREIKGVKRDQTGIKVVAFETGNLLLEVKDLRTEPPGRDRCPAWGGFL